MKYVGRCMLRWSKRLRTVRVLLGRLFPLLPAPRSLLPLLAALCLAVCLAAPWQPADARRIYKWVDEQGITHYSDRKPDHMDEEQIEGILVWVEGKKPVQLRDEMLGGGRLYHARNLLHGPVEVELKFAEASNIVSDPPAPVRHVLPAQAEEAVITVAAGAPGEATFRLVLDAVPGDPRARIDESHLWQIPFGEDDPWRIDQAFGGNFSHTHAQSFHAVDFATPAGTPIRAARSGSVMAVETDFYGSGLDREKYGTRANYVRLLHEDGSMSIYAHLEHSSVRVHPGQRVQAGQVIGLAGDTGFATGPHLHFAVQVNKGMRLETVPFRFAGPQGAFTPERGMQGGR